ncbi:metallophosphoesterase [Roseobacter sp. HKCCA0434]|uniref:metallophosphoesterase n=1 Tax=Roseobacter sp. HKCCA0434 TaxID=3079297 RepID=UPI002905F409|nr:metallophosphoesterase [Roseobacter sp. HKCCA0434]
MGTDGYRIYAIGDVHGMLDALREVHAWIARDRAEHPGREVRIVHMGDYTDRGPDSRGVIDWLMSHDGPEVVNLKGNHDRMFRNYVATGAQDARLYRHKGYHWLHPRLGGKETLASYGVKVPSQDIDLADELSLHEAARDAVPQAHLDFIDGLRLSWTCGDYHFVHAGVDVTRPLDEQDEDDLLWMREGWIDWDGDLPRTVVHGHTVVEVAERYRRRIAIDTGSVFGGALTCLVLDGDEVGTLTGHNVRPLPVRS